MQCRKHPGFFLAPLTAALRRSSATIWRSWANAPGTVRPARRMAGIVSSCTLAAAKYDPSLGKMGSLPSGYVNIAIENGH